MSADDALPFIDDNKYFDLYRTAKGKKLLAPSGEQVGYIFVAQVVVSEVQRNKILVCRRCERTFRLVPGEFHRSDVSSSYHIPLNTFKA